MSPVNSQVVFRASIPEVPSNTYGTGKRLVILIRGLLERRASILPCMPSSEQGTLRKMGHFLPLELIR